MLDKHITFTYRELVDALDEWVTDISKGNIPDVPEGDTLGTKCLNHILSIVNKNRQKGLTSYRK